MSEYDENRPYHLLLDWHLKNGTRPKNAAEGRTFWTNEDFADECSVSAKAVSFWRHGRHLPRAPMQDMIEGKLFGKGLNAHHLSAKWQSDLRKAYNIDFESAMQVDNEEQASLVESYREKLKKEFHEIVDRLNNPISYPRSRARQVFYGWQSLHELSNGAADPAIAFYLAKGKLWDIEASYRRSREKNIADHIVTLRFYAFCMAALGDKSEQSIDQVVGTFIDSLLLKYLDDKSQPDIGTTLFSDIARAIDETRIMQSHHRLESICELLSNLGKTCKKLGLNIEDVYAEELKDSRKEGKLRNDTEIEKKNVITHKIDIYFLDHEGYYYNILYGLLLTKVNFIRTLSETIVPGKLARARLWINCADPKLKHSLKPWLVNRIPDELQDKIFNLSIDLV